MISASAAPFGTVFPERKPVASTGTMKVRREQAFPCTHSVKVGYKRAVMRIAREGPDPVEDHVIWVIVRHAKLCQLSA